MGSVPAPRIQTTSDTEDEINEHHRCPDQVMIAVAFQDGYLCERFYEPIHESTSFLAVGRAQGNWKKSLSSAFKTHPRR